MPDPGDAIGTIACREGVVIVVRREGRFLIIRRAAGVLAEGMWCFVGGGIEPGESQADAAAREFTEEVGGRVRPVCKVWEYERPDGRLRLHWWLADLVDDMLVPNPLEVAEIRWATAVEIAEWPDVLESNRVFVRQHVELIEAAYRPSPTR